MDAVGNEHIEEPDVADILNLIEKHLPAQADSKAVHTIFRVPKLLRQANDEGFEPQLLPIGPFHHGEKKLKPMEQKKLQYLRDILYRNRKDLKDCVKEIMKVEAKARKCYSEGISLGRNEFAKMMVIDGCFLVEMFLRIHTKYLEKTLPQFISQELWLPLFVNHDMLLLENQIPFFILHRIVLFVGEPFSIKDLALYCFKVFPVMPLNRDAKAKATERYHHLLDLFHHHCLPHDEADHPDCADSHRLRIDSPPVEEQSVPERGVRTSVEEPFLPQERRGLCTPLEAEEPDYPFEIPSAEELQDAGIKFKRKQEMRGNFLAIEFQNKWAVIKRPVMKIPFLYYSDDLKFIFRNLIAYEHCNPKVRTFFTGYAAFMDHLINTAKDVRILRRARILDHGLGSDEELAQHFNQLSKEVLCDPKTTHLCSQGKQINKYCGNWWNIWRATLVREYFYSPWAAISLAGALLALALTIFNTGLSIYSTFYA